MNDKILDISDVDFYQIYRECMQKEKDDINQKGMWNLVSHSFLFSSYANMINTVENSKPYPFDEIFQLLVNLVPLSGCFLSSVMLISVMESTFYMRKLKARLGPKKSTRQAELPLLGTNEEHRLI